jgi:methylglyoxal reductase
MDELQALKASGKVRLIGISVPDHRHDMVIALVQSGLIDSVQTILNVFASESPDTLIPLGRRMGPVLLAASSPVPAQRAALLHLTLG